VNDTECSRTGGGPEQGGSTYSHECMHTCKKPASSTHLAGLKEEEPRYQDRVGCSASRLWPFLCNSHVASATGCFQEQAWMEMGQAEINNYMP